uniref:Uncharacterized protein n=1 Tax=Arundo donax TaxID=35708 RepID=A0A0A8Z0S7_ARUDO
MRRFFSPAL